MQVRRYCVVVSFTSRLLKNSMSRMVLGAQRFSAAIKPVFSPPALAAEAGLPTTKQ